MFLPVRGHQADPSDFGLDFEDLYFRTEDGETLHGWLIPGADGSATGTRTKEAGSRGVLLWAHGNAGNIGHRVEQAKLLHSLLGVDIFLFDYRGYGLSS